MILKTYKIEINPTKEQKLKIERTIGTCRFMYNFYISHNKKLYENGNKFMSGFDFSKWVNNIFLKENPEYLWIKDVSSKSIKQSIMNAEKSFKMFFKKKSNFPRYKKKNKSNTGCYFPKNNKTDFISIIVVEDVKPNLEYHTDGIGIDLGIKNLAICSNNMIFKNINKTSKIKRLEKSLKRQ